MKVADLQTLLDFQADDKAIIDLGRTAPLASKGITFNELFAHPNKQSIAEDLILTLLGESPYESSGLAAPIVIKQRCAYTTVATDRGMKFVKLSTAGVGVDELRGGMLMSRYFPTIKAEVVMVAAHFNLVIQPFEESIGINKGMLTDVASHAEINRSSQMLTAVAQEVYGAAKELTLSTLTHMVAPAKNDRFFYGRLLTTTADGAKGRLQGFYEQQAFSFGGSELSWEDLCDRQVVVDGVLYKETISTLLHNAKKALHPQRLRPLALTHGDGHEMNIATNALTAVQGEHRYAYLDMETAGINQILPEMAISLVYTGVMADYIIPKYFADRFAEREHALDAAQDKLHLKHTQSLQARLFESRLMLDGVELFGTQLSRKTLLESYLKAYIQPVISFLCKQAVVSDQEIEDVLSAAITLRLLGVYNLQRMEECDQIKLLGLLYKTVGTPVDYKMSVSVVDRFLGAL